MNTDHLLTVLDELPVAVMVHDDEALLYANKEMRTWIGMEDTQTPLEGPAGLYHPGSRQGYHALVDAAREHREAATENRQLLLTCRAGGELPVEVTVRLLPWEGTPVYVALLRDDSARRQVEEKIRHQANYDSLTGLPNRTLFLDRLKQELVRARRSQSRVALMFLDLDRFKWVNDTLGHAAGDQLLIQASARIQARLRQSDTVARLGGDEFTVILPDMARGPFAERVAGEILKTLAEVFILDGQEAYISGSIGVTVFPDDADNVQDLLKNADSAMYKAKSDGRNAYRFFTPDMHAEAHARMMMEKDLQSAVSNGEMEVHYQPIVDLRTNAVVGAESLLRWKRRGNEYISPDVFIPLAEETGTIAAITQWGLEQACTQAKRWSDIWGPFLVSFNLSCTRCRELSTADRVTPILQRTGLPPGQLVLEVTENILMEDEERAMAMLNHLVGQGVKLWLDDFGTGYSSLSVLKKLPVTGVKIDRSFVPEVLDDPDSCVLVEAIMSMASSLHRLVIGEGVEMEEHRDFLLKRGCQLGQGYYFGRPMPAEMFAQWRKAFMNRPVHSTAQS
ncbi:MAG: EAL domain-containing protein [Magnetococcus sp. WYHC-3]